MSTTFAAGNCSSDVLSELLVLPEPWQSKRKQKRKPALNSRTVCITEDAILEGLKAQKTEKLEAEATKKARQLKMKKKRQEREERKEMQKRVREVRKKEQEKKKLERELEKQQKTKAKQMQIAVRKQQTRRKKEGCMEQMFEKLTVSGSESSTQNDAAMFPVCGTVCGEDD